MQTQDGSGDGHKAGEVTFTRPTTVTSATGVQQAGASSGALDMTINGRRYRIRWLHPGTVEQLRVNVRVEAGDNGSGRMHVETLDLFSPRSRQVFATRAARALGVTAQELDEELSAVLLAVDQAQRAQAVAAAAAPAASAPAEMSDAERAEALELLRDPHLMDRIAGDMEALGYVGEEGNKRLAYLVAVSRKLPEPLSAIVISQSGAGKSGLTSTIERLVPPEDVVFWSRLTPQALYYVEKDFLKRKLVVIEEREGSEAADYSIRALQSRHKLVQAVPVKDPATGSIQTRTMEVEGPAAFLETMTRYSLNPENASRCFELFLDETPAQTLRIQAAQRTARTATGSRRRQHALAIERVHRNAQRLLVPVEVRIPYAEQLTYPIAWMRTRRDNQRLLNLIEAITFLHQQQRALQTESSGARYIEATVEDYAIAYALAAQVLDSGLDELKKPVRDALAVIEQRLEELAKTRGVQRAAVEWTRRDVREWTGQPSHHVKQIMRELENLELVELERSVRGSRYTYRLATDVRRREPLAGLLTPVALYTLVSAAPAAERATPAPAKVEQSGKRPASTPKSTPKRPVSRT